jgi:hypothetical protein
MLSRSSRIPPVNLPPQFGSQSMVHFTSDCFSDFARDSDGNIFFENIRGSPCEIELVVGAWQRKGSWVCQEILKAVEARRLTASNIWIIVYKFELFPVEEICK